MMKGRKHVEMKSKEDSVAGVDVDGARQECDGIGGVRHIAI